MSVAELVLRLGGSLTAWLVLLTHCVWLAALSAIHCTVDDEQARLVLLLFTPVTWLFCAGLRVGFAVPGIGSALRLPGLLLAPLLLLAAWRTTRELVNAANAHQPICDGMAQTTIWWSGIQLATLLVIGFSAMRAWRSGAQ